MDRLKELPKFEFKSYSKIKESNFFKKLYIWFFTRPCPSCDKGTISYIGDDFRSGYFISIYECNTCKKEYV